MSDTSRAASPPAAGAPAVPAGVHGRIERLLAGIAAEEGAVPSVRWLVGAAHVPVAGDEAPAATGELVDVVVAHDVLPHAADPVAAVVALQQLSRRHLIVSAPREPLAHLGITLAGRLLGGDRRQRFSTPDLLRLASTAGAVRATALPWPWTLLWVRRT